MDLMSIALRTNPGTHRVVHRVRVLEMAGPVARAVLAGHDARITAIYDSTVTVRCGPALVNLSTAPVTLVCSARVSASALVELSGLPVGSTVRLDASGTPTRSMRLVARPLTRPFDPELATGRPSWFDTEQGRRFGGPRLAAAARALAEDSGADALLALCGLGIGLTPSGDDALVGMLAVAQCMDAGAGCRAGFANRLDDGLTTEVSLGCLRLALGGEFSAPVLRLLDVLATPGATQEDRAGAAREVARIGHSSGADLLAGVGALTTVLSDGKEPV